MGQRSRPRRSARRAAATAQGAARAAADRRWARRVLVGCTIAWVVGVVASSAAVAVTGADVFVWGFAGGKVATTPATVTAGPGGALALAATLLAVPLVLAAVGVVVVRDRSSSDGRAPVVLYGTASSNIAAVAAVALVPNVVGCLWVSGARPGSDLLVAPMAWPIFAAVVTPAAWAARDLVLAVRTPAVVTKATDVDDPPEDASGVRSR